MVWLILTLVLVSCGQGGDATRIAAYGEYGAELARTVARHFPYRSPGSDQESKTADYLVSVLETLGLSPSVESFQFQDENGQTRQSQNVVAKIEGRGFTLSEEDGGGVLNDSQIIIGANYDVPVTGPDYVYPYLEEGQVLSRSYAQYNGIHDNASGLSSVMVTAYQMTRERPGYDVTIVFFGAGNSGFAGARAYLSGMNEAEREKTACVYNIGPVYAGDKVYAHAGQNSLADGTHKSYDMRRKLYEATDIFFQYQLNTNNRYALYTNQSTFFVTKPDEPRQVVFREWTTKLGNHTPFDEAGLPIVFFESGDYNIDSIDELGRENINPEFRETNGRISGTPFDEEQYLFNVFRRIDEERQTEGFQIEPDDDAPVVGPSLPDETEDETDQDEIDQLTRRINNTAFILVQAAKRGPDGSALAGR